MLKCQQYKTEVNILLRALGKTDALITDITVFSDLLPSKNIDKKVKENLKENLKKIETKYKIQILFGDKIADVAEKMYNYLPF